MTINIENAVFAVYKQAAQVIRDRLHERGCNVPLNELIELLINAELSRPRPEDIARQFLLVGEWVGEHFQLDFKDENQQFLFPHESGFLPPRETGTNPIAAPKPDQNSGAERLKE